MSQECPMCHRPFERGRRMCMSCKKPILRGHKWHVDGYVNRHDDCENPGLAEAGTPLFDGAELEEGS